MAIAAIVIVWRVWTRPVQPKKDCEKGVNCRADFTRLGIGVKEVGGGAYLPVLGQPYVPRGESYKVGIKSDDGFDVYADKEGVLFVEVDGKALYIAGPDPELKKQ